MQDYPEERIVDAEAAIIVKATMIIVIFDKAQFSELIHEEINARAGSANHSRQHFLRYFGNHLLWLGFFAVVS